MGLFDISVDTLSDNEKKIADYVLKNVDKLLYLSIDELAGEVGLSTATISRFWKRIGYKSFKDAKDHLKESLKVTPASKMKDLINRVGDTDIPGKIILQQIDFLQETMEHLSREELGRAVDAILKARNIYIFGPGPSESLVDLLHFRLNRFGKNVFKMPKSGREIYEYLIHASPEDVVIVFGFLRPLPEIKVILENAKLEGYTTILFTDLFVSEMVNLADIVLYSCRGEMWEFHSMVGPMAVIDCLVVSIAMANENENLQKLDKLSSLRKRYYHYIPR